jgi:glutathione peroxidase
VVKKYPNQNQVYQWLSDAGKNGWNNKPPSWNFTKYLVSENGVLTNYFGPGISPMDEIQSIVGSRESIIWM